jgi:hypothetical protein
VESFNMAVGQESGSKYQVEVDVNHPERVVLPPVEFGKKEEGYVEKTVPYLHVRKLRPAYDIDPRTHNVSVHAVHENDIQVLEVPEPEQFSSNGENAVPEQVVHGAGQIALANASPENG